jgi:DNA (cytosine-5)-methyltransferase 1
MSDAASLTMPCPTVTAHAPHLYLAEPFIVHYYGTGVPSSVDQPLRTVTTKERHGLAMPVIERNGERYLLDIRFRMLQPHELALAQGFHPTYRFAGTKTDQVRQIGNAVPRRLARALVAALVSQNPDVSHLAQADDSSAA